MSSGPRRSSISLSVSDMLTSDAPPDRYGEQHEAVGHAGPSRGRDPHTTSAPAQHGRGGHYHPPGKMPSPDGLPPPMLILPHPRHSRPPYPPYYDDHRGPPTRQRSDPMPGPYQDRERLRGGYYDPRYEPYPRRSDHHRPPYPADDS
ncbi:uncharacterized protein EHS24_008921 [Apiotrichum porosum]|uniref:Uncharacterized protein n=1 Tax=Apiotrichum porosum TaxID=105984 RepID=A0A427XN67_9TREE|nr:uncharacterized protein EHS24_008921 [Apiotrichum porosum]RSH80345.1 hypothetical protein EHS24_008921 [Apiotrichum porosum]